jgi:uncharacterized protein with von Willebrand factor type A (vWA) domain
MRMTPPEDGGRPGAEPPDPDDFVATRDETLDAVVGFARSLRSAGIQVPVNAAVEATRALSVVGRTDKSAVRAAMRATLLSRREDVEAFEDLFERFWRELRAAGREPPAVLDDLADAADPPGAGLPAGADAAEAAADEADAEGDSDRTDAEERGSSRPAGFASATDEGATGEGTTVERARYSPAGGSETVSRSVTFDRYDLAGPVARLTDALGTLPGRRRERAGNGRFVDARRALRSSFQTGGVVPSLPESDRAETDVRGVVLVDVSQSVLDSVDREFLLEWLRLLVESWRSTRVFFFDTDVREVTDAFDGRTVEDVTDALADAEASWGGGTRIGHALATLRREAPEAVDRRTVVTVVSDGLERGDVDDLETSAAWIGRRARLFLWLNPLATSPVYEPTARGMAAALPAVDGLFAFAGPADVTELARQLARNDRTRLGYRYDPRRTGADEPFSTDSTATTQT